MTWVYLLAAAWPVGVIVRAYRRECPACRTAAASPLVWIVLLVAVGPYALGVGVPHVALWVAGFAAAWLADWASVRFNRWLHTAQADDEHLAKVRAERLFG